MMSDMQTPRLLFHHVGVAVQDLSPPEKLFAVLGLRTSPPGYIRELDAEVVEVECGPASLCLWHPRGGDNPMARWMKLRGGPGLHHVMFDVENLPSAVDFLKRRGVRFLGGIAERPHQRQAFIDPDQAQRRGVMVHLPAGSQSTVQDFTT